MSAEDRERWNQRYRDGAYAARTHPSAILAEWLESPRAALVCSEQARPRVIDLACGLGRNSLHLARAGWDVLAVDVSDQALARLDAVARAESLSITCLRQDLESVDEAVGACRADGPFDLALVVRYLNLPLIGRVGDLLKPGGTLLAEVHLQSDEPVAGPGSGRFRAAPGELEEAVCGLALETSSEGLLEDPDGRRVAVARIEATRSRAD